ncbi:hypothetical protein R1sor_007082 [Riccia sorocarpa]|uniref:Uncharacterized protein n=1 Tax=Riccia sorocarpa TaxID=122646 RepID=A0ABD3HTJ8_9MARC
MVGRSFCLLRFASHHCFLVAKINDWGDTELVCVFTASLIDVFGAQEVETSERPLNQCSCLQHLPVLTNEVFKTERVRRAFPSELQGEVVFANQLLEFLISGILRPLGRPGVEDDSLSREALTFRIFQDSSHSEKIRIVTSAGELLAFLCIGVGNLDFLRQSIYLILRYCTMDSWWLLSAISSFARVCGRQLFASRPGDISGQAVTVVISELLKDAEGADDLEEDVSAVSTSTSLEDASQEMQEKYSEDRHRVKKVASTDIFSNHLQFLRSSVGKFEDNLNFETVLPEMFEAFFRVTSPDVSEILSGPEYSSSGPASTGRSYRTVEDHTAESAGAACVGKVDGPASQICGKIKPEDIHKYCWQCSYSRKNFQGSHFVGSTYILNRGDSITARQLKFHEITHALELVAFHLGWEWTYNDLLVEHLSKRVCPGAPEMAVSFVAESLGILGRLGIEADGTELPGVREVRGILHAILESGVREAGQDRGVNRFSFLTQVAAAESLLSLCKGVRKVGDGCLTGLRATSCSILAWFQALDPGLVMSLPSSIRNEISSFVV